MSGHDGDLNQRLLLLIITHQLFTQVQGMIYNGYSTDNKSNHQNEEKTYLHSHEHILSMYKEKKCSRKPKKNKKRQNCQKTTELSKTRLTSSVSRDSKWHECVLKN